MTEIQERQSEIVIQCIIKINSLKARKGGEGRLNLELSVDRTTCAKGYK